MVSWTSTLPEVTKNKIYITELWISKPGSSQHAENIFWNAYK